MINVHNEATKHLNELDAFNVPNPIVAKAITMQRLMNVGISENAARKAIEHAFVIHAQ